MPVKRRILANFGFSLVVLMVAFLFSAFLEIEPVYVDFPCESALTPASTVTEKTRIVYCISIWPRNVLGGGRVYFQGSTSETYLLVPGTDILPPHTLILKRNSVVINDFPLQMNETYERSYWRLTYNPWEIYTSRIRMTPISYNSTNIVFVKGDIYEERVLNPIGPICLFIGIGLWIRQRKLSQKRHLA